MDIMHMFFDGQVVQFGCGGGSIVGGSQRGRGRSTRSAQTSAESRCVDMNADDFDENGRLEGWPMGEDEEEEEEEEHVEHYFTVESWEKTTSASRATTSEQCRVRFSAFEDAPRPDALLEKCIKKLFTRILAGRPPPERIGFQMQFDGMEKPFFVPMRPPGQNSAQTIANALLNICAQSGGGLDIFSGAVQTKALAVWRNNADKRGF